MIARRPPLSPSFLLRFFLKVLPAVSTGIYSFMEDSRKCGRADNDKGRAREIKKQTTCRKAGFTA
jgi:hypothetical protein